MNLRRSLVILLTVICITVNVAGLVLYARYRNVKESEQQVDHSHKVIIQSQTFYGNVEKLIAIQRGYLLSRDKDFLMEYQDAALTLDNDIKKLLAMTEDNPKQQARMKNIGLSIFDLKLLLDEKINLRTRNTKNDFKQVKGIADDVRVEVTEFITREQSLLRKRLETTESQEMYYFYTLFLVSAASLIVLILSNALILTLSLRHRAVSQDLNEAQERFELALQGTSDGIFDWNFETQEFYHSARFREMLGYNADEMENTIDGFNKFVHPEDVERVWAHFNQYLKGELLEYRDEFRMQHKDGSWRWHLARAAALYNDNGRAYRFVGAHTDITDSKISEERLRASNKELEEFTYIASHDLRSPLVNLKGFAGEIEYGIGLITEYVEKSLPLVPTDKEKEIREAIQQDIPQSLNFIKTAVTRMEKLTRAILELSRVGRRQLRFEPLKIKQIVDSCLKTMNHQITNQKIVVFVDQLPDVLGDSIAIEQVFGNLIDNAIKYLDPKRPGRIEISGMRGVSETVFRVTDNGRGIRQEDLKKIFELFKRAGKHGNIPGEGMGLSYVQTILRRHGGAIWLESEIDKGTSFYFSIPHHLNKETTNA